MTGITKLESSLDLVWSFSCFFCGHGTKKVPRLCDDNLLQLWKGRHKEKDANGVLEPCEFSLLLYLIV